MKKRVLALLLCTALLLVIISGCGSNSTTTESSAGTSTAVEEPVATESAETPEAAPEEVEAPAEPAPEPIEYQPLLTEEATAIIEAAAEAANAVPSEEVPEEEKTDLWKFVESDDYQAKLNELRADVDTVLPGSETRYDAEGNIVSVKDVVYAYPLDDGHSITVFAPLKAMLGRIMETHDNIIAFQLAAAETNIDVEFTSITGDSATQMNLMFASGDYMDIVAGFSDYTGTTASAYENDLIIPLNDYLEDYAPNYNAWLNSNSECLKSLSSDDGLLFEFWDILPAQTLEYASWVRTDLLAQFGMDSPVTIDEYEEYFEQCVNAGLTAPIFADTTTWSMVAINAFDLPDLNDGVNFDLAVYHIGDTFYSAYQSETLRDYVDLMRSWYEKGFFSKDLVSFNGSDSDNQAQDELVVNGQTGYMIQGVDRYTNYKASASVEGWDIEPARSISMDEDQMLHFAKNDPVSESNGSIVITTACDDIEAACRYLDWFYTDIGIETMNYGPEGVTWNWSEDGQTREFTAALYNDQVYNENAGTAVMLYTGHMTWSTVTDPYAGMYYADTDKGIDALEIYNAWNDSEYYFNDNYLSLTVDESDLVNNMLSDLTTYISETLVMFLVGDKSMDEWDSFEDTINNQLGLQTIVDTYQGAYDRYLAR